MRGADGAEPVICVWQLPSDLSVHVAAVWAREESVEEEQRWETELPGSPSRLGEGAGHLNAEGTSIGTMREFFHLPFFAIGKGPDKIREK